MRLKDLSLAVKFGIAFGFLLVAIVITGTLGWLRVNSILSDMDHARSAGALSEEILTREIDHLKFVNKAGLYFSDPNVRSMEVQTDDHQCALGKWLYGPDRQKAETFIPALLPLLQKLEKPHADLHNSVLKINNLVAGKEKAAVLPEVHEIFKSSTNVALASVQENLKEIVATIHDNAESATKKVESSIASGRMSLLAGMAATVFLLLLAGLFITRKITGITHQLVDMTTRLGDGDMTVRSPIVRKDEIGQIASATNHLAEKIELVFVRVNCSASTINASSENLDRLSASLYTSSETMSNNCRSIASAAEQMNSNMSAIAAAAEQTSTNVSMVAAATEEMTATIAEIASSSGKARAITSGAVVEADKARDSVKDLAKAAELINKVTQTINEIADQTNLLALNATIEAARAGDAGKGFAVVANEIKDLAKQTTEATREIQERIEGVQKSSEQTIAVINTITGIINTTNEVVSSMAAAVEEQAITSKEIAENVSQASQGMHEVTENIAQASTANTLVCG